MDESRVIAKLERAISEAGYRIQRTQEDAVRKKELAVTVEATRYGIKLYQLAIDELERLEKDLTEYNNKKEEEALSGIYAGIYSAQSIIPDSGKIKMVMKAERARLVQETPHGLEVDVNLLEGSALRAMVSFFTRDVFVENSEFMDFLIYDEPLATLSGDSSSDLSRLFNVLGKRKQILLIEQKEEIFTNIENLKTYYLSKVEGRTIITKTG